MMQENISQIYLGKPSFESKSRRMANAATLCYLLYKVTVSKKQSKNQCFFLTEIGRTQYLINSCLSVPVTANNAGCNIASISYRFFFLCLVSYITPLMLFCTPLMYFCFIYFIYFICFICLRLSQWYLSQEPSKIISTG